MNIRYFFTTDQVEKVNVEIEHYLTDGMVAYDKTPSEIKVPRAQKFYTWNVSIVGGYLLKKNNNNNIIK